MKGKRHFFNLSGSIVNTSIALGGFAIFLPFFILATINGVLQAIIGFGVFLFLAAFLGVLYLATDGWAYWEADEEKIVVFKLLRRKRTVLISKIVSVDNCKMDLYCALIDFYTAECYEISDGRTAVKIPKSEASTSLVHEIEGRGIIQAVEDGKVGKG